MVVVVGRKRKNSQPPPPVLGANLRRLREAKQWTGEELAAEAEVHRVTISDLENHKSDATTAILLKLAKALGVRPGELLEEPEQAVPIEPLLQQFLASPYAVVVRPEPSEIAWLRSRPGSFWFGVEPSPAVLGKIVEAHREELRARKN